MKGGALDPLLAPALQMAERPVICSRRWAEELAHRLTAELEELGRRIPLEGEPKGAGQLANLAEAMGVCVISLCAYARGVVPRVASQKPNQNLIVR